MTEGCTSGLGRHGTVDVTVRWPGGKTERYEAVEADRLIRVDETTGIAK
jgi:hypothetical protein